MTSKKSAKATKKAPKREKVIHPASRKVGQIMRSQSRQNKLAAAAAKRLKNHTSQSEFLGLVLLNASIYRHQLSS